MKKVNFIKENLASYIFITFIAVIAVLYIFLEKPNYSNLEKRYLADTPTLSGESLLNGDFMQEIDAFLSDRTPMRSFFVGVNSYYNLLLGRNGTGDVYLGKNGMLLEKPCDRDNRLEENITRIRNFSDMVTVPVSLVAVPSKGYVYSENLPYNSLQYLDKDYLSVIKNTLSESAQFIDISDEFLSQKNNTKLYYNTDHHWTSSGAYTAYEKICSSLGLEKTPKEKFNIDKFEGFKGTSYSTSAFYLTEDETIEMWINKETNGKAEIKIMEGRETQEYDNMFFTDNLGGGDEYTVFLDGNHSLVNIHNDKAPSGKLLVVKDSFAHCIVPFLSDNYSDIIMVDLRFYKKPLTTLISDEKIDSVMFIYGMDNLAESTDIVFS